jgi:surface polysaccharide O-acyltransferase-like enzyme
LSAYRFVEPAGAGSLLMGNGRHHREMAKSSIAFHNLRGLTILLVVAFHSVMAYLAYNPAAHPHYEMPPLFSDAHRWIGFDLFCATQYVFLMQLMFLLSGLFVWPSLVRRGGTSFLYNRFLRLGVPFVLGLYLLIPAAHVPVYLLTARDPTLAGYWTQWTSLPVWPIGHLWFLSALLALDVAAAALYWFAPAGAEQLGRLSANAKDHPLRYFFALLAISAVAYVPLSLKFQPWQWTHIGPFEFQTSYVLMYVVYFFAGLGIGAFGLEASLFSAAGRLPQCWKIFTISAIAGFCLWISAAAASTVGNIHSAAIELTASIGFVIACTSACFALPATFLRFSTRPSSILTRLGDNALGIYFFHLFFTVWLQYLLLDLPLFAVIKAALVFTGAVAASWAAAVGVWRALLTIGLLREPSAPAPARPSV